MKLYSVAAIVTFFLFAHGDGHQGNIEAPLKYDTSKYVVFQDEKMGNTIFARRLPSAKVYDRDLNLVDSLLNLTIANNQKTPVYRLLNASKYYKQVVAVINEKGEKEVWVNCLCGVRSELNWRKEFISVLDGGPCYFNVKINLNKKICYDLMINNYE